jgi:hypothetical protein
MTELLLLLTGGFTLGYAASPVARAVALRAGFVDTPNVRRKPRHQRDLRFQFEVRSDRFWVGVATQRLYSGRSLILNPLPCLSFVWTW